MVYNPNNLQKGAEPKTKPIFKVIKSTSRDRSRKSSFSGGSIGE